MLGPPVEEVRIRVTGNLFSVVYVSRGTPPPKKGKRGLLGDLVSENNPCEERHLRSKLNGELSIH